MAIDRNVLQQEYLNNILQNSFKGMKSSFTEYQNSSEKNAVKAPQALLQALEMGIPEELVNDNKYDAKVTAFVAANKMAEYFANEYADAVDAGDTAKASMVQQEASRTIHTMSNYSKDNRDQFQETLGALFGFGEDGQYTTFGKVTSLDEGMQLESTMMQRVMQTAGDMSLTAGAYRGWKGRRDEIDRAVVNEAVGRGVVGSAFETGAGIAAGVVAGALESIGLQKLGGVAALKYADKISKKFGIAADKIIRHGGDATRYLTQGAILSGLQSYQDQVGLTEKYNFENGGYVKLMGDALQNVGSMMIGDKITSPLFNAFKVSPLVKEGAKFKLSNIDDLIKQGKGQKEIQEAVKGLGQISDFPMLDDYITQSLNYIKDPSRYLKPNANTVEGAKLALGKVLSNSVKATLFNEGFKPAGMFAGELATDYIIDLASTSALAHMSEDVLTVHQKAMYNITDMLDSGDFKGALQNILMQRVGMKVAGRLTNVAFEKATNKIAMEKQNIAGTPEWAKKEFGENMGFARATTTRLNNLLFGNDMRDMDNYIRSKFQGEYGLSDYIREGNDVEKMVMAYFFSHSANNQVALGLAESAGILPKGKWQEADAISKAFDRAQYFNLSSETMFENLMSKNMYEKSEIKGDDANLLNAASNIANKLTENLSISKQDDNKFILDEQELNEIKGNLATLIRGFSSDNHGQFFDTVLKKIQDNVQAKALEYEKANNPKSYITAVGLGDVVGLEKLRFDQKETFSIDPDNYQAVHASLSDIIKGSKLEVTGKLSKAEAEVLYKELGTYVSNPETKEVLDDIGKYSDVLPRSAQIDYENIKDITEFVKTTLDANGQVMPDYLKDMTGISKFMRDKADKLIDMYYDKIIALSKNISKENKPTMNESNEMLGLVVRMLNSASRLGLSKESQKKLLRIQNNKEFQKIFSTTLSKRGSMGSVSSKDITGVLGEKGFNNIVTKLIKKSSNVATSRRAVSYALMNQNYVENKLAAMYGGNDINKYNAMNWLTIFGQSTLDNDGKLEKLTINDGNKTISAENMASRFTALSQDAANRKYENFDEDDLKFAFAVSKAKKAVRERFTDPTELFNGDLKNGIGILINSKGGVEITVNIRDIDGSKDLKISAEALSRIVSDAYGVIKTDIFDINSATESMASRFDYQGNMLTPKEIIAKLRYNTLIDIDVKQAILMIAKYNAKDIKTALSDVQSLLLSLDPKMVPGTLEGLSRQLLKEASAYNAFDLSIEMQKNGSLRHLTFALSNQSTYMDTFNDLGVFMMNIGWDDELATRIGSNPDNSEWNNALEALGKKGLHLVTEKGNTTEGMFAFIPDTDSTGRIDSEFMLNAMEKKLTFMSKDSSVSDKINDLISKIRDLKGKSKSYKTFATLLKDYASILYGTYDNVKGLMKAEYPKRESLDVDDEKAFMNKLITEYVESIPGTTKDIMDILKTKLSNIDINNIHPSTDKLLTDDIKAALKDINIKVSKRQEKDLANRIKTKYEEKYGLFKYERDNTTGTLVKGMKKTMPNVEKYINNMASYKQKDNGVDWDMQNNIMKFLMYGNAEVAEDSIIKRASSYSNYPVWFKPNGDWLNNDVKNMFESFVDNTNIVFCSLGGDGACYAPMKVLKQMGITTGNTLGKVVANSPIGGMKLNYFNSERLYENMVQHVNAGQVFTYSDANGKNVYVETESDVKKYLDNTIFIDVTAFKTILPEVASFAKLSSEADFQSINRVHGIDQSRNRKLHTLSGSKDINQNRRRIARLLGYTALHSATETSAKSKGELGFALDNIPTVLNQRLAYAHVNRMAENLDPSFKLNVADFLDPARFGKMNASLFNIPRTDTSIMAKVNEFMALTQADGEVFGAKERAAYDRIFSDGKNKGSHNLGEMNISSEMIVSMLANMPKKGLSKTTTDKIKALQKFWDAIKFANTEAERMKFIDDYRKGIFGIPSHSMQGDWVDGKGFVAVDNDGLFKGIYKDYYEQRGSDLINKKYTKESKSKSYKSLLDNISKETLNILSGENYKGSKTGFGMIQKYEVLGEDGTKEQIFMVNGTRYPNQRVGQNGFLLVNGIHTRDYGVEISDYQYREIMGGDLDGDAIQIIGLDTKNYYEAVKASKVNVGTKVEDSYEMMIKLIEEDNTNAILVRDNNPSYNMKGSDDVKHFVQPGSFVKALDSMQLYSWLTARMQADASSFGSTINHVKNMFYKSTESKEETRLDINLQYNVVNTDPARRVTFVRGNPLMDTNFEFTHTLDDMVQSKQIVLKSGKAKTNKGVSVLTAKDSSGQSHTYLVEYDIEGNDFYSGTIVGYYRNNVIDDSFPISARKNLVDLIAEDIAKSYNDSDSKNLSEYIMHNDSFVKFNNNDYRFVTYQMTTDTANGIGVDNMKNNTLAYFISLFEPGTPDMKNKLDNLIANTSISLSLVAGNKVNGDDHRWQMFQGNVIGLDKITIDKDGKKVTKLDSSQRNLNLASKIADMDFGNVHQMMINEAKAKINSGMVAGFSLEDFRNVTKLFGNVTPTSDELSRGMSSAMKAMNIDDFRMPMALQVAKAKIKQIQNSSPVMGNSAEELLKCLTRDLQNLLRGNIEGNKSVLSLFMTPSIKSTTGMSDEQKDVFKAGLKGDQKETEIASPLKTVYDLQNNMTLLKQYLTTAMENDTVKNVFKIISDSEVILHSKEATEESFLASFANEMSKVSRSYISKDNVARLMQENGIRFESARDQLIAQDLLVDRIAKRQFSNDEKVLSNEIKDAINANKQRLNSGFKIMQGKKALTLNDFSAMISSNKNYNKDEAWKTVDLYKTLVGYVNEDQQRILGLHANGLTTETIRYINMKDIGRDDLIKIEDIKRRMNTILKLELMDAAVEVKDEVLNTAINERCQ